MEDVKICICSINDLIQIGCQCGAMEEEREKIEKEKETCPPN